MNERREWDKRMRKDNERYTATINALPSLKTGTLSVFQDRVRQTLKVAGFLFKFCRERAFRSWRFKSSRFSKKAMANAARKILDKRDPKTTLLGCGDWSNPPGLKGLEPAPVKKLRRELRKMGVTVVKIDEHRTSLACSQCCVSKTKNVRYRKNGKSVECHQTIRCLNNECGVYWQRDVNASRNIFSILMAKVQGIQRPPVLHRGARFTKAGRLL